MANCPSGGSVNLTGTGTSSASVAPTSLTFDDQKTGTSSQPQSVVVSNSSTAFNITAIAATGDFEVTDPVTASLPVTVAANGTTTISVRYRPTTAGSSSGTLTITTNEASTLTVPLSGSKVALATQVSPTTVPSFGEQRLNVTSAPSSTTVTVRNAGGTDLTITGFPITGPFALVSPPTTPLVLAAGATSQPLQVTFTPTTEGDVTGALNITTDETDPTDSTKKVSVPVSLSGKGVKPNLGLVPTGPVAFGEQRVTTSVTKTVKVSNTGSGPIAISSITKTGAAAFTFTSTLTAPFTLAAGADVNLSVTFLPTSEGDAVGTLNLVTADADYAPSFVVDLTGKGVRPNLVLDSDPLAFGDVRVNASSTKTVKVTNIGTGPITLTGVTKGGHTAYSLLSPPSTPFTLGVGDSQTFSVKYSPVSVSTGTDTGTISLATADPGYTPNFVINITGKGVKPVIGVNPSPLAFGELRVTTEDTKTVSVNNTGNGPITITGITQSGSSAFTLVSPPATPFTIGANSAQGLSVKFSPTTETAESGTLTLATSDPDYSAGIVINLSGTGINPSLFLDPSPLAFSDVRVGTSSTKTVTLKNNGTGTIYITSLGTSGHSAYSLVSPPGTPFSLAGGATTTLSVKYNPTVETAAGSTDTGTLTVLGGSNLGTTWTSATATLTGKGVKPNLVLSPSPLGFGNVRVSTSATLPVTVKNTGTGPITLSGFSITGSLFSLVSPPTGSVPLAPGAEQVLTVKYSPTAESTLADQGVLTVTSTDTDFPSRTVNVTGKGVKPNLVLDPGPLAFGDVRMDTESTLSLTVRNTGSGSLNITEIAQSSNPVFTLVTAPTLPLPLAPGANTVLSVKFKPVTLLAAETAVLTVATDDPDFPSRTSALSGRGVKPNLVLDTTTLAFGEVRVGTSPTKTVTLTNTGSGPISITGLSTGTGSPFSLVSPPATPFTLAAGGGNKVLTVKFSPTAEASSTGTLTITSPDADFTTSTVALSGQGVKPNLVLSPSPVAFGDVRVGEELTKLVQMSNNGTGPITISGISAGLSSTFTLVSPPATPFTMAAGDTKVLTVKFSPSADASATGTLTVTTQDTEQVSVTDSLTGRGVRPAIVMSPSPLAFGDVRVSTVSTKTVTVSNNGSGPILISGITKTGSSAFTLDTAPATPFTLAAGANEVLTVKFSPLIEATASDTGVITLTTQDPGLPSVTLNITGRGVKPTLVLSPNPLAFGDVRVNTSLTKTVTVSNTGTGPISISGLSTGTGSPFTLVSPPSLPFNVAAGTNTTLSVKFTPTADASAAGTLTVTSSDSDFGSSTVDLSGRGVVPNLVLDPSPLAFGPQIVGTTSTARTVKVTNSGTGPVRINGISITAGTPFSIVSSTAAFDLPASESADIQVKFSPTTKGDFTANLILSTDDASRPSVTASLLGKGTTSLRVDPAELLIDFGEVAKDQEVTRTVTLTNDSAAAITGLSVSSVAAPFTAGSPGSATLSTLGAATSFTVKFKPTAEGPFSALVTVQSDASNGPHVLTLKGTGTVPMAKISLPVVDAPAIASYDFQGVRVNATAQTTLRFTNTGKAPLTLSVKPSISSTADAGTSVFSYLGPDTIRLEGGTYFDFQVSFQPAARITYTATLTISSNATNSPTVLSLTGFGADPELTLDRTSVFFGDVRVGSRSAGVPVTINNTGNAPVSLQNLPVAGPFEVVLPKETDGGTVSLPKTIAVRGSFTFDTVYRPTAEATQDGTVSIITDMTQTADAGTLAVALSGNGTTSRLATSVSALDFGGQRVMRTSGVLPVVLSNPGRADLSITDFIFSNPAFSVAPASPVAMPLTIGAGQQVPISLVFTPSTLGSATGQFFIISNAANSADAGTLGLAGKGIDGQLTLTPSVVSFDGDGGVEVGAGAQQTVMITNSGEATLTITGMDPPDGGAFTVSGLPTGQTDAGVILQPTRQWPITVTFTPEQRGYVSASAIIRSDSVISPAYNMLLRGTGVAAAVELLPSDIYFGKSNVGVSTGQDISIKNVGERDLYVSNISFVDVDGGVTDGGTSAALDFSIGGGDGGTGFSSMVVAPGTSHLVPVKFTPQEVGVRRAQALVFTNDKVAVANLTGEGVSPNLALLPSAELDFKSVVVNKPSAPRILTLKNTGNGTLTVYSLTVGGADATAFILTTPTLPLPLQPGASTDVSVQLKPDAERQFTGQLVIRSNDPDAPSVTVPMYGTGVRQQILLSKSALEFGQQLLNNTSLPRKVLITNSSDTNVTLTALTVEGTGASQFTLPSLGLPYVLTPGRDLEVGLTFTPLDTVEVNCTLKISFSELPLSVALHGTGVGSVLSITPSSLEFGGVRVGGVKREQSLTITNRSGDPIVLAAPRVTDTTGEPFTYDGDSLAGRELAPSMSVIVPVGYQPMVETFSQTTLSFATTTPATSKSVEVTLKGNATKRLLSVDQDSLDFGFVPVNKTVDPKEVIITNKSAQQQRVVVMLKTTEGSPFALGTKALADAIPAGGTATFSVAFDPDKAGEASNDVQVYLQGANDPEVVIPVKGVGRAVTGGGGGCSCDSTEAAGSAGLLMLLALVGSRRQRRQ
ncbi:choice-of-anchor D domain-containing protein [Archangium sp.]|uniref:choice-of-anchor D domain-containing protein n=1 Tax=Archangium sp. TaxID=1872627 RepID=UPI00389A3318